MRLAFDKNSVARYLLPREDGVAQSGSREAFRIVAVNPAHVPGYLLKLSRILLPLTSDAALAQSEKNSHNSLHLGGESCETRGEQTSDVSLLTALWFFTKYQPGAPKRWYAILYVSLFISCTKLFLGRVPNKYKKPHVALLMGLNILYLAPPDRTRTYDTRFQNRCSILLSYGRILIDVRGSNLKPR